MGDTMCWLRRALQMWVVCVPLLAAGGVAAEEPTREQVEFFEKKIRPVLVAQCYKCHSSQSAKVKGGLVLDTREGLRKGGDSGPTLVPGDAEGSRLLKALR